MGPWVCSLLLYPSLETSLMLQTGKPRLREDNWLSGDHRADPWQQKNFYIMVLWGAPRLHFSCYLWSSCPAAPFPYLETTFPSLGSPTDSRKGWFSRGKL